MTSEGSEARVIVRTSEARVIDGMQEEFLAKLLEVVADYPRDYPGLLSHDILRDQSDPTRFMYVSRWRDEESVARFAGPRWRDEPVTFPNEDAFMTQPLSLRHFLAEPLIQP